MFGDLPEAYKMVLGHTRTRHISMRHFCMWVNVRVGLGLGYWFSGYNSRTLECRLLKRRMYTAVVFKLCRTLNKLGVVSCQVQPTSECAVSPPIGKVAPANCAQEESLLLNNNCQPKQG